jgi:hypothetical protein
MASSRRSPVVIGAFALTVLITGALSLLLVSLFKGGRSSSVDAGDAATTRTEEPGVVSPSPVELPEARRPPPRDAGADVPVWARTPGVWTTPYPEGGKINPPLPPVKLLPGMLPSPDPSPVAGPPAIDAAGDVPSP